MLSKNTISKIWGLTRSYLVATVLIVTLIVSFIEVYTTGTGPRPQGPPLGYEIHRLHADLEWSKGNNEDDEVTLQVSLDDPDFKNPMVEKVMKKSHYPMDNLEPGHTYYWRLVQAGKNSPTSWFETLPNAVKF